MEKSTTIHEKTLRYWQRNPSSFEDIFQLILYYTLHNKILYKRVGKVVKKI